MISDSFRPLTISSKTHMLTSRWKRGDFSTLYPIILEMAEPLQEGEGRGEGEVGVEETEKMIMHCVK